LAAAVEHANVAHALHQLRTGAARQLVQGGVARSALAHPSAHFDELVIGERAIQFTDHTFGETGVSQHDQRAQRMRQPAQVLFLLFRKRHRGIIVVGGARTAAAGAVEPEARFQTLFESVDLLRARSAIVIP